MYSPEEKAQLRQLEDMGCKTMYETNIKEVEGGFILSHRTSYVLDGEVKGVTQEQIVCAHHYAVAEAIASLYGDKCMDIIKSDPDLRASLPKIEHDIPYDQREGEVRVPRTDCDDARTR